MRIEDLIAERKEERAGIVLKAAPLKAKREELRKKLQPLEDEMRTLNKQIQAIEGSRMFELDNEIGGLTRSLKTTKQLNAETMQTPMKVTK